MLDAARQGYIYQDIVSAYFVANEIACGRGNTKFHFDQKKTSKGVPDKFDDLAIYTDQAIIFIQIKYSNLEHRHKLSKSDFATSGNYDLALFDLFETWKALHKDNFNWRICAAWDEPELTDGILNVIFKLPENKSLIPGTTCYQFDCDVLWPENGDVLSSWRTLRKKSQTIDRTEFKKFLDCLVIEVNCPKSSLLEDNSQQLEKLLFQAINRIGVGIYPNDHLTTRQVAESLCTITMRRRSEEGIPPISCDEIAKAVKIKQEFGGIEQKFPIDKSILVDTPERVSQITAILEKHKTVIVTAEPGAGKSWFIENLTNRLGESTQVIKHYCYIALEDPLALKRITINVLYGSLIKQILEADDDLHGCLHTRYGANLEQLNTLLGKITKKTLLIIDGIDHIWRVYQKNRGGLTEDETKIIEALGQLDFSNQNLSVLIISQPVNQLEKFASFHHCTLAHLPEDFVKDLMKKHALPNLEFEDETLSSKIHRKSNGNGLYCRYLIEHSIQNKDKTSFEWIDSLPPYDFNLASYYQYLYDQIEGDKGVPLALCGSDFSVTKKELVEITHLGDYVTEQLASLKPILKYLQSFGYSIYHESFKRFVVEDIKKRNASIADLVYRPIIEWLETHSFFESTKAFCHLLKLYYEVDAFQKISQKISEDFISDSLYHAQPLQFILQNHKLQKTVLKYVSDFKLMIIISEQAKIISDISIIFSDDYSNSLLIKYLKAIQKVHDDDAMYRVLWDGEHLNIKEKDAWAFLIHQIYEGNLDIHWGVVPELSSIPFEILGYFSIKLLHTRQYDRFDELIEKLYKNPEYEGGLQKVLHEVDWYYVYIGNEWVEYTPFYKELSANIFHPKKTLSEAIGKIISYEKDHLDDNWEADFLEIVNLAKYADDFEIDEAVKTLSGRNWFYYWMIYLIKISKLSQTENSEKYVIETFSYLVRDLKPFAGKPRVCDLYSQLPFIKKSFHRGLILCKGDETLLLQCCELLEKVIELSTSIQGSVTGPLTNEEYLELISSYLSADYVIKKYEEFYAPLGVRRLYPYVAEVAFDYAYLLGNSGKIEEAQIKFREGIQALTAYGYRKDRTLSEIMDNCVKFHKSYDLLGIEWFFELYYLSMSVIAHTDGKSTSEYPIEWFREFIKVYPEEALKFLITETIVSDSVNWHQEEEFFHLLEQHAEIFSPTQWFLLCRSLPLASSNDILSYGLDITDQIDEGIKDVYHRWLQSRPFVFNPESEGKYSEDTVARFEDRFGISINGMRINPEKYVSHSKKAKTSPDLPGGSLNEAMAFFETNALCERHFKEYQKLFNSLTDIEEKKLLLRQTAKSFKYEREIGNWITGLFVARSFEWLYLNICIFAFSRDGWGNGLHFTKFLKDSYDVNPQATISILHEVLGNYISDENYTYQFSGNLIGALTEINFDQQIVDELFTLTYQIIKKRLPNPPEYEINSLVYQGLDGFNQDELVVAILIARLKTLTTEKSQGIVWALSYLAQTSTSSLFKPYIWAFSNHSYLLPIHRAILLQLLINKVDIDMIPDGLISKLIENYPTGYFLEDQYIRRLVDYKIDLKKENLNSIIFPSDPRDDEVLLWVHPKYHTIVRYCGPLTGTFSAYAYKRDKIASEYGAYYIRSEKIATPIVPMANAAYEIINNQFYEPLKELTYQFGNSYVCDLDFCIDEITLQIGALVQRPTFIPFVNSFPPIDIRNATFPIKSDGWILLALKEDEIIGEQFKPKTISSSSLTITTQSISEAEDQYAAYLFRTKQYQKNRIEKAQIDKPICRLDIPDYLENSKILYVSPFIIRELGLHIDFSIHNGFFALNDNEEVIVRMLKWKEDYYGDISDGTEIPRLNGVAVLIREDYYYRLLTIYDHELFFLVDKQSSNEEQ